MKLIPVYDAATRRKVRTRTNNKLQNIILEFMKSTSDTSLVSADPDEYTQMGSLSGGLRRAAKRLNINVTVVQLKNKVYLMKEKEL